jgi:hypothetical protein
MKAYGTVVSFTTRDSPGSIAQKENRTRHARFNKKYGVAVTDAFFTLTAPAATDSDRLVSDITFAAGDVKVSKNGGAFANVATLPTILENGYLLQLSATEMEADEIDVVLKDAAGGPLWRDKHIHIDTEWQLGNVDIDAATGTKATNTTAFKCTGYGSGHGLEAIGGSTGNDIDGFFILSGKCQSGSTTANIKLSTAAAAADDTYNGCLVMVISGDAAGESRLITDYDEGTDTCTVDVAWKTAPAENDVFVIMAGPRDWYQVTPPDTTGTELSGIPTYKSSFADLLQALFQWLWYQKELTATVATMRKVDDSTALGTTAYFNNGTTEQWNRME